MEQNKKTLSVTVTALENLFQSFNHHWYNGELEAPVIAVSPDHTNGAYGWCTTWKAWKDKPNT